MARCLVELAGPCRALALVGTVLEARLLWADLSATEQNSLKRCCMPEACSACGTLGLIEGDTISRPVKLIEDRSAQLVDLRNLKMARSPHGYVRGNTSKFYESLNTSPSSSIPQGPAIWICGTAISATLARWRMPTVGWKCKSAILTKPSSAILPTT